MLCNKSPNSYQFKPMKLGSPLTLDVHQAKNGGSTHAGNTCPDQAHTVPTG